MDKTPLIDQHIHALQFDCDAAACCPEALAVAISALKKQERYEALLSAAKLARIANPSDEFASELYQAIDALEDK